MSFILGFIIGGAIVGFFAYDYGRCMAIRGMAIGFGLGSRR